MQSKAPNVAAYLEQLPAERRGAIKKLRQLCRESLKGYQEGMEYGMPGYKRDGVVEISFASQVQYISLYVLKKEVVDRHRESLPGCKIGKGCIRFSNPEKIDFEAVRKLLQDNARSKSKPC